MEKFHQLNLLMGSHLGSVLIGHHQKYKQVLTCCHKCIYIYIYILCNELLTLLSVQCMARIRVNVIKCDDGRSSILVEASSNFFGKVSF